MTVTTSMVLGNLDGWYLDTDDIDEEIEVHTITAVRVTEYIGKATSRVLSHLELTDASDLPVNDLIDEAISTWAAGLLYQRDIDREDPDKTDTRGFDLINDAKALLKPFTLPGSNNKRIRMFSVYPRPTFEDEDDISEL